MKRFYLFIFIQIIFLAPILSQKQVLTLEQCMELAIQNHPLFDKKENIQKIYELDRNNLNTAFFPKLEYNAQALYQHPVLEVDLNTGALPFPLDFPTPNKDQYKTWLDIKQNIYDGGLIKKKKQIEYQSSIAQSLELDITLEKSKQTVNDLFFNVLKLDKQIEQLTLTKNELTAQLKDLASLVNKGVVLNSNYKGLQAEIYKLDQRIILVQNTRETTTNSLKIVLGYSGEDSLAIQMPDFEFGPTDSLLRTEYIMFEANKKKLMLAADIQKFQRRPLVFGFSQIGYGNPGLNMLNDTFEPYYIVGAGLKWNIYDWKQSKRNINKQYIQIDNIELQKSQFDQQLKVAIGSATRQIEAYQSLLKSDETIIEMYQEISKTAYSRFQNGAINSSEYISELNREKSAILNHKINEIQLNQLIAEYYLLTGKL